MPASRNIIGPDPLRGATNARPARTTLDYALPYWFRQCLNPADPNNTRITTDFLNEILAQLREAIPTSGVTEVEGIGGDEMLAEAIARYASRAHFGAVGGTANALVVTRSGSVVAPKALFDGMRVHCVPSLTNTAATTADVFGLGAKAIRKWSDAALAGGELVTGRPTMWEYRATANGGAGAWLLLPWADASIVKPDTGIVTEPNVSVWATPGTYTFTVPAFVTAGTVEVWAGGGGGGCSGDGSGGGVAGNAGAGGGGGGFARKLVTGLVPGATVSVTVGAGGTAGTSAAGGTGGSSSFGAHCSATGGAGGSTGVSTTAAGGNGGAGTGGDINITGGTGGTSGHNTTSTASQSNILHLMARGGLAPGGLSVIDWFGTGAAGRGRGTGGAGASGGSGLAGGAGAPGMVVFRW